MPIIISSNVPLSAVETGPDHPLIGYDNIVTSSNIVATSEVATHPATDLANPATNLYWQATSAAQQYLTVTTDGLTEVEYVSLVGHNLGDTGSIVSVEGYISSVWTEIEAQAIVADNSPLMWRLTPQVLPQIRIRIQAGSEAARAAVMMVGELLVMEQRLYSGHVPVNQARKMAVSNGRSESGDFVGRIVIGEERETTAQFKLLTPLWVRDNLLAFLDVAKEQPFMFAWRPATYPLEVGYCWLINDPQPMNGQPSENNLIAVDLQLGAVT